MTYEEALMGTLNNTHSLIHTSSANYSHPFISAWYPAAQWSYPLLQAPV